MPVYKIEAGSVLEDGRYIVEKQLNCEFLLPELIRVGS